MKTPILGGIFTVFASMLAVASPTPQIMDLGSLGGASAVGFSINGAGAVAGYGLTSSGYMHAFSYTPGGSLVDLNGTASQSYAYGVNNSGTVVGVTYVNGQAQGTVWSSGGSTSLRAGTYALDINASGEIAGGDGQAAVFSNGTTENLGFLPGGNWSSAYGINDTGQVVGYSTTSSGAFQAFSWSQGTGMTDLGTLGGNSSYAMAISDTGEIVGHSAVASGYSHAFADFGGTMLDLGTLGGSTSYAYGVNNAGAVVGYSVTTGGSTHAFVFADGAMLDLNSLLPADSGWVLTAAYGINDAGDIVGTGLLNGQEHAFVLDPPQFGAAPPGPPGVSSVPEPASLGLMGTGIGFLAWVRWRKRAR